MFPILCVFYDINLSKLVSYRKCEMIPQRKPLPDAVSSRQELRFLSCFPWLSHTGARQPASRELLFAECAHTSLEPSHEA